MSANYTSVINPESNARADSELQGVLAVHRDGTIEAIKLVEALVLTRKGVAQLYPNLSAATADAYGLVLFVDD